MTIGLGFLSTLSVRLVGKWFRGLGGFQGNYVEVVE